MPTAAMKKKRNTVNGIILTSTGFGRIPDYLGSLSKSRGTAARWSTLGSSVTAGSGVSDFGETWFWKTYQWFLAKPNLSDISASNNGFGGFKVADLISNGKPAIINGQTPDFIILEACAINDWGSATAIASYKSSIATIISDFKTANPKVEVLVTSTNALSSDGSTNALGLQITAYNTAMSEQAAASGVKYFDVYSAWKTEVAARGLTINGCLADGTHPNTVGYDIWFTVLSRYLALP